MIALVQRVREASVSVGDSVVGEIGMGLLILLAVHVDDTPAERAWVLRKCAALRVFPDADGQMNRSVRDVGGEALVVSQFTLYGDVRRGNRPSYVRSARPEKAEPMVTAFAEELAELLGRPVPTGRFGAMMDVRLLNDGPVTIWIEKTREESEADGH